MTESTTKKKPAAPRKRNVKTPGDSKPAPLDPKLVPPAPNTSDAPVHEDTTPAPEYVVHKLDEPEKGRVMGSHVLTEKGWIRQE